MYALKLKLCVRSEASFSIIGEVCAHSCAGCVAATLQTVSETDSQTAQINVWSCSRLGWKHVRGAWTKLIAMKGFYYN